MTTLARPHPQQEQLLPQNIDAEMGVLGSIIIDPDALLKVADFLRPEAFYRDAHRTLYEVIVVLYKRDEPADFMTICDALERSGTLSEVGGASYITSLIDCVPTSGNIEHYARIVERTYIQRRLIQFAGELASQAYDMSDVEAIFTAAQHGLADIMALQSAKTALAFVNDLLGNYMLQLDRANELVKVGQMPGIDTGFTDLNRKVSGFSRGELIVLAARPSIGKSALALNIALEAAKRGQNVVFFSVEMGTKQLLDRMLAIESGVDAQQIGDACIVDEDWGPICDACGRLGDYPLWVSYAPDLTTHAIQQELQKFVLRHDHVDLVVVDYVQIMSTGGKSGGNRVVELGEITRELKKLAGVYNVPLLALAQLSRSLESRSNKVPQLYDLRESGSFENDADKVLFIYRDEVYNPDTEKKNIADIIVAKNRNGPTGEVSLYFHKQTTRFGNLEHYVEEGHA